ncbi:MAG: aminotransferase class I/II-fold pyridoxal phosphate-dependent enzyme, partial [Candidatus Thorarchaeota archaeon]
KHKISRTVSALVINTPNNPTGGVLSKDNMKLSYDLAEDHDTVVFSDEIYESLVYDGFKQTSMLEIDPTMERTLVISGLSKSHAMTGWRLGYAIGNDETISNMTRIQQNTTSCAASFTQYAGAIALTSDQSSIGLMVAEYQKRRDVITHLFNEIEGIACLNPKGAFYVFPNFVEYGLSSATLAEFFLKKIGICTSPGGVFGEKYDSYLRFSYSASLEDIEEGMAILTEFLPTIK